MANPIPNDWFAENAPAMSAGGGDWFANNAPAAAPKTAAPEPAEPAERPGFFKRLAQSFGLPDSNEGVAAAKDEADIRQHPENLIPLVSGAKVVGRMAGAVVDKVKQGAQEGLEAERNVKAGGPLLPNIAKASFAGLPDIAQGFGEDIANKNYSGAAGTAAGVMSQAALAKLPSAELPKVKQAFSKGAVTQNMASELHASLDRVANEAGLPASKSASLSGKAADVVHGLKQQAQSIYGELDRASGGRYQRFRDEIDDLTDAIQNKYTTPDVAAKLKEKLAGARQDYANVQRELIDQGVDPQTIKAADGKWAQAKALETVGKQFKKGEYYGGELRPGTPAVDTGLKNLKPHILPQATKGEAGAIRESVVNATKKISKVKRNQAIAGVLGAGGVGAKMLGVLSGDK
jgi:hypothetical protein